VEGRKVGEEIERQWHWWRSEDQANKQRGNGTRHKQGDGAQESRYSKLGFESRDILD